MYRIYNMDLKTLLPLVSLGSLFNTLFTIEEQGYNVNIQSLYAPAFLNSFGGGLIGNLVYKEFSFSSKQLSIFFLSLILFPLIRKMRCMKCLLKVFPAIGTALFFVSLKNNKESILNVLTYLMVSDVFSKVLNKILIGAEMIYTINDVHKLLLIFLLKYFKIPDAYAFSVVFCHVIFISMNFTFQKLKNKIESPITQSPAKVKKPVRKASMVNKNK